MNIECFQAMLQSSAENILILNGILWDIKIGNVSFLLKKQCVGREKYHFSINYQNLSHILFQKCV